MIEINRIFTSRNKNICPEYVVKIVVVVGSYPYNTKKLHSCRRKFTSKILFLDVLSSSTCKTENMMVTYQVK